MHRRLGVHLKKPKLSIGRTRVKKNVFKFGKKVPSFARKKNGLSRS